MNSTIETQLAHRTIRQFTGEPIPEETMQVMFDVAMRTSTSRGFQHAAIIRVKDQAKRDAIAAISGQGYIAEAPELLIVIVDARRSVRILEEHGEDTAPALTMDVFREGFTDGVLMVQNMTVAAESLGLGVTHLGSVLNDYAALMEVLELPQYTFPVLGMILGVPNQEPQLKPRMPRELRVMTDVYTEPENWSEALADYDQEMQTYYDLRDANRRVDAYTTQIVGKIGSSTPARDRFVQYIAAQGFIVDPDAGAESSAEEA